MTLEADASEVQAISEITTLTSDLSTELLIEGEAIVISNGEILNSQQPLSASAKNLKLPDLVGQFGTITLPDTIEFGDQGTVTISIKNTGKAIAKRPINIELWSSTDNSIDGNDVRLINTTKNINLNAGKSVTFTFNYDNITSAIAPGAYNLIAKIDSTNKIVEQSESNKTFSRLVSASGTNVVIDWTANALNAIQVEGKSTRGIPPTSGSRLLAILLTSVFDTVNAFTQSYTPYAVDTNAPASASLKAAVVGAAHRVLTQLMPEQSSVFNRQLVKSLIEINDGIISETVGVLFGRFVADQMLALRTGDGSDDNTPYAPPAGDYVWQPDSPNFTTVGQNWGRVTPWAIPSVDVFAPDALDGTPTNNPDLYAQEIEEVRLLGGRFNTDITTLTRTVDQTEIAIFWAYDRADTFRPYGQLNQIAQEIAVREGTSLAETARLFVALNVALADAAIVAWDAKYQYTQPRPDDVIAGDIAANDGIDATIADPNWKPLLDTPLFPDYISGHSTFGGAFAGVLTNFFGDNYEFDAVSQELPGVVRHYDSFSEFLSRITR